MPLILALEKQTNKQKQKTKKKERKKEKKIEREENGGETQFKNESSSRCEAISGETDFGCCAD